MRLAHLSFTVDPADRQRALDALLAEVPSVRQMQGCVAFTPFADPTHAGGIGVVHEWETGEDFAAYLASPAFANSGKVLRPLMIAAPVSRRFDAELAETVN